MQIRCPHCHNPIEIVEDSPLADLSCPSCGSRFSLVPEATEDYKPEKSRRIAHFQIESRLGTGSFGTVWKARDTKLDRTVAIKVPRAEQLDAVGAEQFLREARAAAQLRHPHIVSVHEVGRYDDQIYMITDYIEGVTLADWISGARMSPREAALLCATIARAVHHAHEHRVIHRDLKPSNIILDSQKNPHVMDFGLAKRESGEVTMTVEGRILGTPAYMSPEQARGDAHNADRRSDVYSLGVILFELLTGERPFRGNHHMLLHQVIKEEAPRPRRLDSTIPKDLETICLQCLQKDPQRRYQTAEELADDLTRQLDGQPIAARPVGRVARALLWGKRAFTTQRRLRELSADLERTRRELERQISDQRRATHHSLVEIGGTSHDSQVHGEEISNLDDAAQISDDKQANIRTNPYVLAGQIVAVALLYYLAGVCGVGVAVAKSNIAPIWPATGVAIAAVYQLGYHVLPGIWLGGLAIELFTRAPWFLCLGVPFANVLEPLVAVALLRRFSASTALFATAGSVVKYFVFAGVLATAAGATLGVACMCAVLLGEWEKYDFLWATWWLGNVMGAVVVAPALLVLVQPIKGRWPVRRLVEAAALILLLFVVSLFIFVRKMPPVGGREFSSVSIYCMPLVIWAALRYQQHGSVVATLVICTIAVLATIAGRGPFGDLDPAHITHSLLFLQSFMGVVAFNGLVFAALVAESKQVARQLHVLKKTQQVNAQAS